jgi:hypothetical protein
MSKEHGGTATEDAAPLEADDAAPTTNAAPEPPVEDSGTRAASQAQSSPETAPPPTSVPAPDPAGTGGSGLLQENDNPPPATASEETAPAQATALAVQPAEEIVNAATEEAKDDVKLDDGE